MDLYAVFGHPIAHSLSPMLHNTAFKRDTTPRFYLPVDCPPQELIPRLDAFRRLGGRGVNLTRPLKELIVPYLAGFSERVELSGAANTLTFHADGWLGENTDLMALQGLIPKAQGTQARALVVGAGGVARTSIVALRHQGYRVFVSARRGIEHLDGVELWPFDSLDARETWEVVVNATPMGQVGETAWPRFPCLSRGTLVVDWVYAPRRTPLLARADEALVTRQLDGLTLLVEQARLAWIPWFGFPAPGGVMAEAVSSWE